MREKGGEITRGRKRAPPLRSSRRGKKGERGSVSRSQRSEKRHGGKRERGNFLSLVSGLISCPPLPCFPFSFFWVSGSLGGLEPWRSPLSGSSEALRRSDRRGAQRRRWKANGKGRIGVSKGNRRNEGIKRSKNIDLVPWPGGVKKPEKGSVFPPFGKLTLRFRRPPATALVFEGFRVLCVREREGARAREGE